MKILLIHQYFLEKDDPGGGRFNEMTRIWAENGHEVTVIAGMLNYVTGKVNRKYGKQRFYRETYQPGLEVIRTYVASGYHSNFVSRLRSLFSFMFSSAYAGVYKTKDQFDVIIVSSPPLFVGVSGLIVKYRKKIPMVFEVRDLWPEFAVETGVLKNRLLIRWACALEKWIYRKSDLINVLTPAFRENLVTKKRVDPEKIIFVPNASDLEMAELSKNKYDYSAMRNELGLNSKLVIAYVGAHGVANHLDQLLDVADGMREQVEFVLVGDGMKKKELIEKAETMELDNVRFVDPVPREQVFKYIIAADIGVSVLKKTDAFKTVYSNKTFDYMACEKPVLMLIDGVSRELVEQAECGLYAEPENIPGISEMIKRYLNDPELKHKHGRNGYEYVRTHFNRKLIANQYLDDITKKLDV